LILDSRVYATLKRTLGVDTTSMAGSRLRKARYRAYVETMHSWSEDLSRSGLDATPERLEWVLFENNGKALQPGS
jgi:GTP cyclohydrolase I